MYSTQEKNEVVQFLEKSREGLNAAVTGLSQDQLAFKPSQNAWSIAGIVEHLAIVEERIIARISQMLAGEPASAAAPSGSEAALFGKITDRSSKFNAPEVVHPTGEPLANSLARLAVTRRRILDLMESLPPDFRRRSMPHPAFGPLDGHQWLVTLAGHSVRHTQQINETKTAPQFPQH